MNQQPNKHQRPTHKWKVVVRTPELRLYAPSDKGSDHRWEGKKVKNVDKRETTKQSFPIRARSGSN
ncbi:hypothetical protein D8674_003495 [Pyrus ussuriensis x Pyrus communis]|uniref:Uncharacterized protein n=1 Tax=Pyrus ussuriensis x Pyrus communis TaxID=2448454 RepID=A0A5N5FMI2_9ROSA|nr:hypothetical protein D8674_003495 [Pyrus ussuriensis x Pyrus communis]